MLVESRSGLPVRTAFLTGRGAPSILTRRSVSVAGAGDFFEGVYLREGGRVFRMRILQVNDHGEMVGGVETYVADLSALLESAGIEVAALCGSDPKRTDRAAEAGPRALARHTVFCPEVLLPRLPARPRHRLCQIIEDLSPDVILAHQVESAEVLQMLCDLRPTVQFVHVQSRFICPGRGKFYARSHEPCRRPFGAYCLIAPFRHACGRRRPWTILGNSLLTRRWIAATRQLHRIMVASEYMRKEMVAVGIPDEKIVVNPLFVLPAERGRCSSPHEVTATGPRRGGREEESRATRSPGGSDGRPLVLFCGRMYDYKGAEYLLDALALLTIPLRVVFVGDGPERPALREKAARLEKLHRMDFTGWLAREEVRALYRQARVLVMPSLWPEPFGRVGIEALAEGTPVVAFGVGAIPEWLADGEVGFLVEPRNIRQLAERIERIVTNDDLFRRLSTSAQMMVAASFNPQRHLERLLDVLRSARSASTTG